MLTPEGRQAIRTLSEASLFTRNAAQAAATFAAITGADIAGLGDSQPIDDEELARQAAEQRELREAVAGSP